MPILLSVEPMGGLNPPLTCTGPPLADGQLATVQAGIAAASPGDVVCVPAGAWTWNAGLSITKRITLKGAGIDQTVITMNFVTMPMIAVHTQPGGLNRLTGFTFVGPMTGGGTYRMVEVFGYEKSVRIDHNKWMVNPGNPQPLAIWDYVRGVADHNIFDMTNNGGKLDSGWVVYHGKWNNAPSNDHGDASFAAPDSWGTDECFVFEDNQLIYGNTNTVYRHVSTNDGLWGSRVTTRYNILTNVQMSGGHGTDSGGRDRGRRQQESYREILNFDCATCGPGGVQAYDTSINAMGGRGSTMMEWDNTITATHGSSIANAFVMNVFRRSTSDITGFTGWQSWGGCGEIAITSLTPAGVMTTATRNGIWTPISATYHPWCRVTGAIGPDASLYNGVHQVLVADMVNSPLVATIQLAGTPSANATGTLVLTGAYDGNTTPQGYPCLDQAGYGQSDVMPVGYTPTPPGWPNQVLTPNLYFLNTVNGVRVDPNDGTTAGGTVLNREFYSDGPASLIRSGPLEARPVTCSVNEIYWAENDGSWNTKPGGKSGKMYKCLAPNVWTPWYGHNNATGEPLRYPHPLTLL